MFHSSFVLLILTASSVSVLEDILKNGGKSDEVLALKFLGKIEKVIPNYCFISRPFACDIK